MPRVKNASESRDIDLVPGKHRRMEVCGNDAKITTPQTEWRVMEIARKITEGQSRQTCLDFIQESYSLSRQQAQKYYNAALNWLVPEDLDEYKKGLLQANIERLEKIIQEGIDNHNDARRGADYLRTAKDAIAELNKMMGIGSNKVTIAENKEGEKAIQIEFN